MKKIININLSGRLIPIEDSAYEVLRQYLDSLKRYFAKEEGGDEIVLDIESRIAELFQDKLKAGAHCITDSDVESVKHSMGTPEQFDEEVPKDQQKQSAGAATGADTRPRKRFYRDPENKVLSGVCGGLGAYFNLDPVIFRIVFVLAVLGSFGAMAVVYVVLWISAPYAETAGEKLEMRGEKVDLNNIKATVQEEMHNVKNQFNKAGNDIRNFSQGRGKQIGNDIERFFLGLAQGLGKVIVFVTKSFFIFFSVVMLFCLVVVGITLIVSSAAIVPLQHLIFSSSIQVILFWLSTGLLIGIPVLALIIFIVRKATGSKSSVRFVGPTLGFLWIVGLIMSGLLANSLVREGRRSATIKETFALAQPKGNTLTVKVAPSDYVYNDDGDFEFGIFDEDLRITSDTTVINDIRLRVEQSTNDSFAVQVIRYSKGRNMDAATTNAKEILFNLQQQDSVLLIPHGFGLAPDAKYRVQRVIVVVRVPKGKNLEMDNEVRRTFSHRFINGARYTGYDFYDNNDWDADNGNTKVTVTPEGMKVEKEKEKGNSNDTSTPNQDKDSLEKHYQYHSSYAEPEMPTSENQRICEKKTTTVDGFFTLVDALRFPIRG